MAAAWIGLGLSAASTGFSIFGGSQDNSSQYAPVYSSEIQQKQVAITNKEKLKGNYKAVKQTVDQILENRDARNKAFSETQAAFLEQMYGFVMSKDSAIRDSILAESAYRNVERYGRSAQRVKNLGVMGEYGRNNAIFLETVTSSAHKQRRDMYAIAKQSDVAQKKAVTDLEAYLDSNMPSLVQTGYTPYVSNNNSLAIAGQALSGIANLAYKYKEIQNMGSGRNNTPASTGLPQGYSGVSNLMPNISTNSFFTSGGTPSLSGYTGVGNLMPNIKPGNVSNFWSGGSFSGGK